jgi:pyridoxine/pyridoxamine 5'-phosphate oxidase
LDPLARFAADRARARAEQDAWASLGAFATVDGDGAPRVRTLVLRDLDEGLGIFVNATSPKWTELRRGPIALVTFLASLNVQYRLRCTTREIPFDVVDASWRLRPPVPQHMDWVYEQCAQGSALDSREQLLARLDEAARPEPLHAPASARGLYLEAFEVDRLDLAQSDGVHDRRRFRRTPDGWLEQVLVP